jgi:RNA polymerase sigma-70 factor (ECF subfamily)
MQSATSVGTRGNRAVADFDSLFREYHRRAYNFAYRLTGNRDDAEDLTQEALLRAYRARERYDPARPFDRWLFRIMSNLFIDRLRARSNVSILSLDVPPPTSDGEIAPTDIADENSDPSRIVLREVMDERLQNALASLPPQFRETVLLTEVEGMSYDEAANQLGCAVGTVRSRIHRARGLMRESLSGKPTRRRRRRRAYETNS